MSESYQPTWGNSRASICHWNLQFRFHTKEQCQKFVDLLMQEDIDFHFEYRYEMNDSFNPPDYWIEIHDMSWAKNLAVVAEILQKVDYCMD